ncbi:MAG: hypothetical protein KKB50_15640 [Planctomycetes bacterium]|nr:hypothetical protein [Planctomycetota bacterium]
MIRRALSLGVAVAWGLVTLAAAPTQDADEPVMQVTVTVRELAERPVSPLIYGNFIESGFGRQIEGMWAEMFFNRGFEAIPPYTEANYGSRGCGPETDVERQPWWHSGYEEQPWELVPGNPKAKWNTLEHISFWNGQRGAWLRNESDEQWAGFAQRGMYLRKGERYVFAGMLRTGEHAWDTAPDDRSIDAEIRIYADGDWPGHAAANGRRQGTQEGTQAGTKKDTQNNAQPEPILTHTLRDIRKAFERKEWTFENPDFEGRATFSIWVAPGCNIGADALSLMPASNVHGWRADVVEVSKRLNPRIIRWPGGCFASFYHWRDGIGERSERDPMPSPFWGGLYDNDVGTVQFIQFCRLVGAEPFICVNVLTGDADEAADWVAYCNAPATHPIGRLRARDGFAEPFGVNYWELDNEAGRRFTPPQYAHRCVEYARAMKAVDPSIELAIVGYDWYRMALREMLETAGAHIDYVVDRAIDERALRGDLDVIGRYNEKTGTNIRLCNTEWPAPDRDVPPTVDRKEVEKIPTAKGRRRCWYSAMNVAKTLLTFQRLGGDFALSNFNNYANTWGQNVIECPKDSAYLSPAGHVFELFSRSPAAWPLELEIDAPRENVVVQAAWDQDHAALCLVVLNYNAAQVQVTFTLDQLGGHADADGRRHGTPNDDRHGTRNGIGPGTQLDGRFTSCDQTVMWADSLMAYNTPTNPCVVERNDTTQTLSEGARFEITATPFSITQAVLR